MEDITVLLNETPDEKSARLRKEAALGTPRIIIAPFSNRPAVVILSKYDPVTDTYEGPILLNGTISLDVLGGTLGQGSMGGIGSGSAEVTYIPRITGLREYPYKERPEYPKQMVKPGEDWKPLLDIVTRNAHLVQTGNVTVHRDSYQDEINMGSSFEMPSVDPYPYRPDISDTAPLAVPGDMDGDGDVDVQDKRLRKQKGKGEPKSKDSFEF